MAAVHTYGGNTKKNEQTFGLKKYNKKSVDSGKHEEWVHEVKRASISQAPIYNAWKPGYFYSSADLRSFILMSKLVRVNLAGQVTG